MLVYTTRSEAGDPNEVQVSGTGAGWACLQGHTLGAGSDEGVEGDDVGAAVVFQALIKEAQR